MIFYYFSDKNQAFVFFKTNEDQEKAINQGLTMRGVSAKVEKRRRGKQNTRYGQNNFTNKDRNRPDAGSDASKNLT